MGTYQDSEKVVGASGYGVLTMSKNYWDEIAGVGEMRKMRYWIETENKPFVAMCDNFYMLLDLFAGILLGVFASTCMRDTGLWSSFSVTSLSDFGIKVMLVS